MRPLLLLVALAWACAPAGVEAGPGAGTGSPTEAAPASSTARASSTERASSTAPATGEPFQRTTFDVDTVPEASGIAVSRTVPGRAYLVDDDRGVFLLDLDSGAVQPLAPRIDAGRREPSSTDLEDVAVGACGPDDARSCVYVGDIGDNAHRRDHVEVWRFPEPAQPPPAAIAVDVVRLSYPDGPHDAEALLVDEDGTPVIITKAPFDEAAGTTGETRVHRAPGFADGTLTDAGALALPEPAVGLLAGFVGNVVTGADSLGGTVVLRTYDSVLLLRPPPGQTQPDLAGLERWTARELTGTPLLPQAEGVALLPDGRSYVTVSERAGEVWQGASGDPR